MTTVADALERLRALERTPLSGELAIELSPDEVLRPLASKIQEIESSSRRQELVSATTLEDAKLAWKTSTGLIKTLSSRHIRALCWDPESALDPAFICALADHPDLPRNRRWLEGLVDAYLSLWRSMPEPAFAEQTLTRAVGAFEGRSDRLAELQPVAQQLFSPGAATWLGSQVIAAGKRIEDVLDAWKIGKSSGLGEATANAALNQWIERFERKKATLRGVEAYGWFRQLTQELLSSDLAGRSEMAKAMSALILWEQAESDSKIHGELREYLLAHSAFGDPRLPGRKSNWDLCDPAARRRVIGWLAKGDLLFFFQFVITDDPHGRRDFWLRYISRAVDAHVALSQEDALRLRAQVREKLSYSQVIGGQGTSAFLMRFRGAPDLLCIEFSRTGNALYVHDADKFTKLCGSIRNPSFNLAYQLKNSGHIERFSHVHNWKWNVDNFLARHGIRPA
jgi:hypothetical protein